MKIEIEMHIAEADLDSSLAMFLSEEAKSDPLLKAEALGQLKRDFFSQKIRFDMDRFKDVDIKYFTMMGLVPTLVTCQAQQEALVVPIKK